MKPFRLSACHHNEKNGEELLPVRVVLTRSCSLCVENTLSHPVCVQTSLGSTSQAIYGYEYPCISRESTVLLGVLWLITQLYLVAHFNRKGDG